MGYPEVSVIIPVYNVCKYLPRAIESVLNQSEKSLELILVDDGSSDGSAKICDDYAEFDSRIRVIHKDNEGVSQARNDGIKVARGEFIAFLDADDYLEINMYERLLAEQHKTGCDMVFCGFRRIYDTHIEEETFEKDYTYVGDQVRLFAEDMFKANIFGVVWRSIYTSRIIKSEQFDPEVKYAEDLLFNLNVLKHANSITVICDVLYNYNKSNEDSVCNRTIHNPTFRYTLSLQRQLEINKYWQFTIDYDEFYAVYVDMMYQWLVRKLEKGCEYSVVTEYMAKGFFSQCCQYYKKIPFRRKIICILIQKKCFRAAVLVRKMEDFILRVLGKEG